MDEARSTQRPEPEHESQVRRARIGLVAGYIHELSERHTETSGKPGRPDTPLGSTSR